LEKGCEVVCQEVLMAGFRCYERVWRKVMRRKGISAKGKKMLYTKTALRVCRR
jgi:hypothetical protein